MKLSDQIYRDFLAADPNPYGIHAVSTSYLVDLLEKIEALEKRIVKLEGWCDT
jgi:hypothetical protein